MNTATETQIEQEIQVKGLDAHRLTPENCRLVEVGTVSNDDVFLHSDLRGGDTKLYAIEAKP